MGPFPILVNGNRIEVPSASTAREAQSMLREAILDGHIPVTMPIGFSVNAPGSSNNRMSAVGRNTACQEAMVAIASNLTGIIFTDVKDKHVISEEQVGTLTTGNMNWLCKGKSILGPINQDQYLLTAIQPVSLKLWVHKNTSFKSMADNAAIMNEQKFFPLNTVHSLADYIRVLPDYSNGIVVRYYKGMTPQLFQKIWEEV